MASVSKAEFARRVGLSRAAVTKLCSSGRIPVKANGQLDYDIALAAYKSSQQVGREVSSDNGKIKASPAAAPPQDFPDSDDSPVAGNSRMIQQFNKAKTIDKTFQAKLRQLEYEEKHKTLVPRTEVEDDAAVAASELRGRLFSIPARAAVVCEGKTAREIERIIETELNQAFEELQARFLTDHQG